MTAQSDIQILISLAKENKANIAEIKKDVGEVSHSLEELGEVKFEELEESLSKLVENFGGAGAAIVKMIGGMSALKEAVMGGVSAFLALEGVKFFKEIAMEGAKAEAAAVGLRSVGEAAGYTAEKMAETTEALDKLGIGAEVSSKNLQKLIENGISPESGEKLAAAARALANRTGGDVSQVFETITQAVVSGRTQMLRHLGINLDQKKIYTAATDAQGGGNLSAEGKRVAVADAVSNQVNSQGSAIPDTTTTKLHDLENAWSSLHEAMGKGPQELYGKILDGLKNIVDALTSATKWCYDNADAIENVAIIIASAFVPAAVSMAWALGTSAVSAATAMGLALLDLIGEMVATIATMFTTEITVAGLAAAFKTLWLSIGGPVGLVVGLTALVLMNDRARAGFIAILEGARMAFDGIMALASGLMGLTSVSSWFADGATTAMDKMKKKGEEAASGINPDLVPSEVHGTKPSVSEAEKKHDEDEALNAAKSKASAEHALLIVKDHESAMKERMSELEKINKDMYDHDLIGYEAYWAAKKAIGEVNADNAIKTAEAEVDKAASARDKAVQKAKGTGASETARVNGQAAVDAAVFKVADEKRKKALLHGDIERGLAADRLKEVKELATVQNDYDTARGDTEAVTARKTQQDYVDQLMKIYQMEGADGDRARNLLLLAYNLKLATAEYDKQKAALKQITDLQQAFNDTELGGINQAQKQGVINDTQADRAKNALIEKNIEIQQSLLDQAQGKLEDEASKSDGSDASIAAIRKQQIEVAQLQGKILSLKGTYTDMGYTLKGVFTDQLGKSILDLTNNVTNLGDAMKKVALSVVTSMQTSVATNLAKSVANGITNMTGGGSGVFGKMADMAGLGTGKPDGTENNPMVTKPYNSASVPDLASNASNMVDTIKTKFGDVTDTLGTNFQTVTKYLMQGAMFLLSTSGGSNGTGGVLSFIGKLFGFAEGGLISGPGGPKSDSIPIMVSSGEHITNAAQTQKWLPLLNAINSGALDNMKGIGGAKGLSKFAAGGLVGSGASSGSGAAIGGQVNNVTVNVDKQGNSTTSGNSAGSNSDALGKAISSAVVQELIKQRRPGGILAS